MVAGCWPMKGAPLTWRFAAPAISNQPTTISSFSGEARATLKLAVPIVGGQLGQMLLMFVDSLMVARVGTVPLAASAFAHALSSVIYVAAVGVLTSIGVRAAQAHGAGKPQTAGEVLRNGLWLAFVVGLLAIGTAEVALANLSLFGQAEDVAREAAPFLRLIAWSLLPALLWQSLKQFCEALQHPLPPMLTVLGGLPLNIGLNFIFIYGSEPLGVPALGLAGAGLSTLITRILMTVVLALYVARAAHCAAHREGVAWTAAPDLPVLKDLLALGIPACLQLLAECAAFACAAIMVGWMGATPLAAHQVAITFAALTFMFPLGISFAVSARMGEAVGAQERHRLWNVGFSGLALGAGVMLFFAAVFLLGGPLLSSLFAKDPEVAVLAASLLAVAGVFQLVDGLQVVGISALRGLSDARVPAVIAFGSYWCVAVPAAWFFGFKLGWGAPGVWWGLAAGLACAAVGLAVRLQAKTRTAA